jgi:hypothetical protein
MISNKIIEAINTGITRNDKYIEMPLEYIDLLLISNDVINNLSDVKLLERKFDYFIILHKNKKIAVDFLILDKITIKISLMD